MSSGRRPTGLCGAAILISARYHGFKRSTQQILQVVRVCNDTIRKRLEEFEKTLVASLTREEFENLDLENSDLAESFPPSFKPFNKTEHKAIENKPVLPIKKTWLKKKVYLMSMKMKSMSLFLVLKKAC